MNISALVCTFATCGALLAPLPSVAQGKSEDLFENCKAHERYKADRAKADAMTITRSLACISYVGAAWQMYNLVTDTQCASTGRTGEDVVNDYLAFTRKSGFLDMPQQFVLYKLFEVCYCRKEPTATHVCP